MLFVTKNHSIHNINKLTCNNVARKQCNEIRVLTPWQLTLEANGHELHYLFDTHAEHSDVPALLRCLDELGIGFKDLNTEQSSLEDIFVGLVSSERAQAASA